MEILRTIPAVTDFGDQAALRGKRLGLVPTMGYLHEGHQSLMRACRDHADLVLCSVFVNPTQFGPNEDLDSYPRDIEGDQRKAEAAGCDAIFLPKREAMYPGGHRTTVQVRGITNVLCGAHREGHFDGVCTIVAKLFALTRCKVAVFGEKDYQQLVVIRRMVDDLNMPVEIVSHPIVREVDGLAMSSRNVYLSPEERARALSLKRGLDEAARRWAKGERDPTRLEAIARAEIAAARPTGIDYVSALDARSLERSPGEASLLVLAVAVRFGRTRLIDNVVLAAERDRGSEALQDRAGTLP